MGGIIGETTYGSLGKRLAIWIAKVKRLVVKGSLVVEGGTVPGLVVSLGIVHFYPHRELERGFFILRVYGYGNFSYKLG